MLGTLYSRLYAALTHIAKTVRMHRWPIVGPYLWRSGQQLSSRVHPSVLHIDGHDLRVDPDDALGLRARGRYEPLLHQRLADRLSVGAYFVDGGAHIGYHALAAARAVGPHGRVVAFEPAPDTFRLLAENVERNGYRNIDCVEAALSDRTGAGTLHLSDDSSGDHRILDAGDRRPEIEIRLHRLDEFIPAGQQVDLVKLDVQGAELLVLQGMEGMFDRTVAVVVEFAPFVLPPKTSRKELLNLLRTRFDVIYDVDEVTRTVEPTSDDRLLEVYTRQNERFTNLLCERAARTAT